MMMILLLQLIVYTDFLQTRLEVLNHLKKLFEDISEKEKLDINEKYAIIYLFDVLSANMLDEREHEEYVEENSMLLNPVERYMKNKGIEEGIENGIEKGKLETAWSMLNHGYPIEKIVEITGLSEELILNSK